MARRILALDLGAQTLKAALIESSLRRCEVRGLFHRQREADRPLAEQVRDLCAKAELHVDAVFSCVPGDVCTHRFLSFPFARPQQLAQAVPFELEGQLPLALDEVVIDFQVVERTAAGATVFAVAVPRRVMTEHLETLAAAGLDPVTVGLAPLAPLSLLRLAKIDMHGVTAHLDIGVGRASLALLREGVLWGVRTLSVSLDGAGGFDAFVQDVRWSVLALQDLSPDVPIRMFLSGGGASLPQLPKQLARALGAEVFLVQNLHLSAVPVRYRAEQGRFAVCLGLGLQASLPLPTPVINLRRGTFVSQEQRQTWRREWTRLGWLAGGVVAAAALAFALDIYRLNSRYEALQQEIRRVFTATLPDVQTIVSERAQLQEAVAALQKQQGSRGGSAGYSPLEVLRQLSIALSEEVALDIEEWTFDEEVVRMRGTTTSFDAAETVKNTAAGLGLFREVQLIDMRSAGGGGKVSFALQMFFAEKNR